MPTDGSNSVHLYLISRAVDRAQVAAAPIAELRAKARNMGVDRSRIAEEVKAPDIIEQLLDDIWGFDFLGDSRTVDSHVARLRTKLGDWGSCHLRTVYGAGYKIEVN